MDLREYQKEGVKRLRELLGSRNSAYLADEMGLGKTAQALEVLRHLDVDNVLIICPAGLRLNWQNEIKTWWPEVDTYPILKGTDLHLGLLNLDSLCAIIISYDLASSELGLRMLATKQWDALILDEAHYCKSGKANRTKACLRILWDKANYRLLLSGTPCPNGIIDGYEAFHKLAPECFPDKFKFGFRYTQARRNWFSGTWEFRGGKNLKELRDTLARTCMVRRTKAAVLSELPDKIYSTIPFEVETTADLTVNEADLLRIESGAMAAMSDEIATRRRGLGLLKVSQAVAHVLNIMESKRRCVVFAYHKDVIKAMVEKLRGYVAVMSITGATSPTERQNIIELFQNHSEEPMVLVGQITAAGVGITLTAADICVFAELDWVPANMAQAIDRLHRIGQKNSVAVHYLIGAGTMDQQIIESLRKKIESINEVLRSQHAA